MSGQSNPNSGTLTKLNDRGLDSRERIGEFIFDRPAQDRLVFEGTFAGHKTKMELQVVDRDKFRLVNSGFHWIIEEKPVARVSASMD